MQAVERQTLEAQLVEAFNQTLTDVYPEAHLEVSGVRFDEIADLMKIGITIQRVDRIPTLNKDTTTYIVEGIIRKLREPFNRIMGNDRSFRYLRSDSDLRVYARTKGLLIPYVDISQEAEQQAVA